MQKIFKTIGSILWWLSGLADEIENRWKYIEWILRKSGFIQKDGTVTLPEFMHSAWFPYLTATSGTIFILLIWRKEIAPILARESLWPHWHFWARLFPFLYEKEFAIEGAQKLRDLIERGRFIANPQNVNHDPNHERIEWYDLACPILAKYYPLQLARFQSLHGRDWATRGHREILREEIAWLEQLLETRALR